MCVTVRAKGETCVQQQAPHADFKWVSVSPHHMCLLDHKLPLKRLGVL